MDRRPSRVNPFPSLRMDHGPQRTSQTTCDPAPPPSPSPPQSSAVSSRHQQSAAAVSSQQPSRLGHDYHLYPSSAGSGGDFDSRRGSAAARDQPVKSIPTDAGVSPSRGAESRREGKALSWTNSWRRNDTPSRGAESRREGKALGWAKSVLSGGEARRRSIIEAAS